MGSMPINYQKTVATICFFPGLCIKVILDPCSASHTIHIPLFSASKPVYIWVRYWIKNEHTYDAFKGFKYWSFPQSCLPLKMTVGFRRDPLAQMMGIIVAVSQFSFRSAICCCIPWGPICRVLWVHLSRKQQPSSIANIKSGSMLYFSMISWRSLYQWFIVSSLTAPPRTYLKRAM